MSTNGHVIGPDGIERFASPAAGEAVILRASGAETDGQFDLMEFRTPPGPGITPLHIHHDHDEVYFVIEGELTIQIGEGVQRVTAGACGIIPRGTPHTYQNTGADLTRFLGMYLPGGQWGMLREVSEAGPVTSEADIERVQPILEEYNTEMVGPPLDESVRADA